MADEFSITGEDFPGFYRLFSERILAFLATRVLEPEVAFDLSAETFASAFQSQRKFKGSTTAEAEAWIFSIARARLAHYYRRGYAERRAIDRLGISMPAFTEEDHERIAELAELDGRKAAIGEALATLSANTRHAVELRIVSERPYHEVASRLGISEDAARARVSRGLKALANVLDQIGNREEIAR